MKFASSRRSTEKLADLNFFPLESFSVVAGGGVPVLFLPVPLLLFPFPLPFFLPSS